MIYKNIAFRPLFLILLFSSVSILNLFSQSTFSTRLGISTLQEIQIEAVSPINDKSSVFTSLGYAFRSYNLAGFGCGTFWPSPLFSNGNKGISLKAGITLKQVKVKRNKTKIRNHTFSLFYRKLDGTIRKNLSGCGEIWRDYEFSLNDIGLSYIKDRALSKKVAYYWSFTYAKRFQNKTMVPGTPSGAGVEETVQNRFIIDIGVRIKLAQTKIQEPLGN